MYAVVWKLGDCIWAANQCELQFLPTLSLIFWTLIIVSCFSIPCLLTTVSLVSRVRLLWSPTIVSCNITSLGSPQWAAISHLSAHHSELIHISSSGWGYSDHQPQWAAVLPLPSQPAAPDWVPDGWKGKGKKHELWTDLINIKCQLIHLFPKTP